MQKIVWYDWKTKVIPRGVIFMTSVVWGNSLEHYFLVDTDVAKVRENVAPKPNIEVVNATIVNATFNAIRELDGTDITEGSIWVIVEEIQRAVGKLIKETDVRDN